MISLPVHNCASFERYGVFCGVLLTYKNAFLQTLSQLRSRNSRMLMVMERRPLLNSWTSNWKMSLGTKSSPHKRRRI